MTFALLVVTRHAKNCIRAVSSSCVRYARILLITVAVYPLPHPLRMASNRIQATLRSVHKATHPLQKLLTPPKPPKILSSSLTIKLLYSRVGETYLCRRIRTYLSFRFPSPTHSSIPAFHHTTTLRVRASNVSSFPKPSYSLSLQRVQLPSYLCSPSTELSSVTCFY